MKLDVNVLRYLSRDDFRTLTAVEMGQKNHEIVPAQLIDTIAGLKHGGAFKCLRNLLRHKLVHHDSQKYDGYRLTTLGYDFLAIRALTARGSIAGVGRQIGVGKESDVFEVTDDEGNVMALKLHRLGRTSFRAVKSKRDYMKRGNHFSWLYLSRLAALKEFAFMKALGDAGLPVPTAIEYNRHAILMSMVQAHPMVQVRQIENPRKVYEECMRILVRLAELGLVHCDYNEFNLLISEDEELTLIDFPQMVSISHANAKELFERDVEGVVKFFERKLGYLPDGDPALELVRPTFEDAISRAAYGNIDEQLRASGFKKEHESTLDRFLITPNDDDDGSSGDEEDGSNSGDEGDGSNSDEEVESEEASSDNGGDDEEEAEEEDIDDDDDDVGAEKLAACSINEAIDDGDAKEEAEKGEEEEEIVDEEVLRQQAEVIAKAADERRRAARRSAMAKVSRNATKGKNKGKRKGDTGGVDGGGGGW